MAINMRRYTGEVWPDDLPLGAFDIGEWRKGIQRLQFICPNGKTCAVLCSTTQSGMVDDLHVWKWDGNTEAPTLSPSVNCLKEKDGKPCGGCGWHGFIKEGKMV